LNPKKVLILTYYWPPSGGSGVQRWVKFCKYLPDFGIEPIVLTVQNGTYPLLDTSLQNEVAHNLEVHKTNSIEPYHLFSKFTGKSVKQVSNPSNAFNTNGSWKQKLGVWLRSNFFIPDARLGWVPSARKKATEILEANDIDTVITTGPPNSTHLIGKYLKEKKSSLKWIMDMRDPWSQIFYNKSLPRVPLASHIDLHLETQCLKKADEVVVISNKMLKLQTKIVNRSYTVITNGFDHSDFTNTVESKSSDFFTIKYVGSMSINAIPHNFFKAISKLPAQLKTKLKIQFTGTYSSEIHSIINQYGVSELIEFQDYLPHLEAKKEMKNADLLLLTIPNTTDSEILTTGKIFDYIASQVPIICIGPLKGEAAFIIDEYQLGRTYDYDEVEALSKDLVSAVNENNFLYQKWETDLQHHPFSRLSLTKVYANLIHNQA
jgi:hypothetical protein